MVFVPHHLGHQSMLHPLLQELRELGVRLGSMGREDLHRMWRVDNLPKTQPPAGLARIIDDTKNRKIKHCDGASCFETEKIFDICCLNGRRNMI